eukprot:TRINITY_DN935_c0_g1_i2.p1 TRINITY_DN935_c0_g1~~TRINITY_DN935_c0_g1_i2.p1  ORF type:complete len:306 (-),score=77.23 TRINITY_DN935_c0_g1_i2:51-968(-)
MKGIAALFRTMEAKTKLFDIAANLADESFKPDITNVFARAKKYGVEKLLMAGTYIEDSKRSYELSTLDPNYYCTAGIHPCRATQPAVDKETYEQYFAKLEEFIMSADKGKLVAVGECGLDYDKFSYADKESQLKAFPPHFDLANKYKLPMYLHERNTGSDFCNIVKANRSKFTTGVVHSFTGPIDKMKEIISMDLYVGVTGCSLRTQQTMDMVKEIPLDRLVLETDSPYCRIRPSWPSSKLVKTEIRQVKGKKMVPEPEAIFRDRNEPCAIIQVLEVVSAIKGVSEEEIAKAAWENSLKVFGITA